METEIPNEYICPISMDIMSDPVICEDGYTYDRECITLINGNLSPMTRQRINKHNLLPNRALKEAIERFKRTNNIPTITEERRRELIENIMRINREELTRNARDELVFQIRNEITEQTRQEIARNETEHIRTRVRNSIRTTEMGRIRQEAREEIINTSRQELRREAVNTLVNDLRQSGISALDRFRREEERRRIEQAERIRIEREQQRKRQQEERIRIEQQRIRDAELDDIIRMFNSKDIPSFSFGSLNSCNEVVWFDGTNLKFEFNRDMVYNLNALSEENLLKIYKKLYDDIIWISKYIYGNGESKPFVDYVFDFKDKYLEYISTKLKSLNQNGYVDYTGQKPIVESSSKDAETYLAKISKSREYYYVNYDEFLAIFGTKNQYGCYSYQSGGISTYHQINFDSERGCGFNMGGGFAGNEFYYHIWHFYDREKKEKLSFLNSLSTTKLYDNKIAGFINEVRFIFRPDKHLSAYLFQTHVQKIIFEKLGRPCDGSPRTKLIDSKDFDELFKMGKILLEFIEFVRPEVIQLYHESTQ